MELFVVVTAGLSLVGVLMRWRRARRGLVGERCPRRLSKPLLLRRYRITASDDTHIEVEAGTPYQVLSVNGRTVLIEIKRSDGTTAQGYTSTAHVRT